MSFLSVTIKILQLALSLGLLGLSIYALVIGIKNGCSITNINVATDTILLLFAMTMLFINEGFQVGALKIQHMNPEADFIGYKRTVKVYKCLYPKGKENALKRLFI